MQEKAVNNKITILRILYSWTTGIVILLAAFLFAMDFVNAETLSNNDIDYIKSVIDNYGCDSSGLDNYYNNISDYDTYYIFRMNASNSEHKNVKVYFFNSELGMHLEFSDASNVDYDSCDFSVKYYLLSYVNVTTSGSMCCYICNENNNTFQKRRYSTGYTSVQIDGVSYKDCGFGTFDINSNSSFEKYSDTYYRRNEYNVISNVDSLFIFRDKTPMILVDFSSYVSQYIPVNKSTVGFNVFKYNNLGTDTLRIVPPQNQVPVGTHSSNVSTVTFDLVIDGTTIPCEYNSESEYYFESLDYARAYYEIPLSALLPSSLNDFDEVYVTNVNYVNIWSNQGGESGTNTFVYVDKCYLKRSISNDDVGQVTITHVDTDTGYTDTEINNINTMISNASTLQGSFDVEKNLNGGSTTPFSFSSFQDAVVREIECWHPTGTKTSDWVSITIDGVTYDSGDNMYWLKYDSNSTQSFDKRYNYNVSPYSYVRENNYSGYYDIIYFIVHEMVYDSSGTGISKLDQSYTRYYYFISDRYYNKLILYREMDILTYIKLNNEIGEKTYNYLFDRLLNIDDNLYYYIKDKAVIDNDILDALEDIDNDMQFNLDIVVDLLNKILNAILELDIKPTDTSAIENKLDDIYTRLGNSNLNSDWYKRYREWLYDETNDNVLNTPHEYMLNTFDDVKALFDVFAYFDLPQTGFWSSAREYLNRMNGNNYNDNINDYLVTGIKSDNFYKDNCNTLVWSDIE